MEKNVQKGIWGSAAIVASATFLSRILGLIREQVFAYFFGAGFYTDAFQIAFRIPKLLRELFAEGAMSSALVPVYTKARIEKGEDHAWKLASNVMSFLALAMSILAIIGIVFAAPLVNAYAPAFSETAGKHELTVHLTRIMWPFLPLVVMAAVTMGILNARNRFGAPAVAPSFFNVASILAAFTLCPLMPKLFGIHPIYGMAIGTLLGGLWQWLYQWPTIRREGFQFHWRLNFKDPDLHRIWLLMGAGTFALAATQINILINSIFASGEGDGAVSWLGYAFRLMQFPIGVFGVAISTVTLSKVSKESAVNNIELVGKTVVDSLRMVFVLTIPSSVGLAVFGRPIIAVIYEHGKFTSFDTQATATALAFYAIGLAAYSGVKVLVPVFYSLGKAKMPIISSFVSLLVNATLCYFLVQRMGFAGLALATSCAALANFAVLLVMIGIYTGKIDFFSLTRCFLATCFASALMAIVLYSAMSVWFPIHFWGRLILLISGMLVGTATYITCARVLGLDEVNRLLDVVKRRFL